MENPSPPATPEPSPKPSPIAAPPQRNGCLTAFMVLVGVVLLLPGLCTMIFFSNGPSPGAIGGITFLVALAGIALIAFALQRTGR